MRRQRNMFPMNMKTKPQKNKGSGDKPSDTVQVMIKKILNSLRRKDEQVKSFKKNVRKYKEEPNTERNQWQIKGYIGISQ